jgi:hypothetical protein
VNYKSMVDELHPLWIKSIHANVANDVIDGDIG